MKYLVLGTVVLLLSFQFATANMYITEIMPSPTITDNDGEWIEIYNAGDEEVNLSNWTLDGNDFDDTVLGSKEYLVIARELVDGDDEDTDSFQSYWGEDINAVDGSFSLTSEDTVTLTNGEYTEEVSYDSSWGGSNGRSIERLSLTEWEEGDVDGSPGEGSFLLVSVTEENSSEGDVVVYITVENSAPQIVWLNITTDDSSAEGVQVMPNVEMEKEVSVEVLVNDTNGFEDVEEVTVNVNNKTYNLTFSENVSEDSAIFSGEFAMDYYDLAGDYSVDLSVSDDNEQSEVNTSFEYLGILSTELNISSLFLNMEAGGYEEASVSVVNKGNVLVDTEVSAEDFLSETSSFEAENVEVFSNEWLALSSPVSLDLDLSPLEESSLQFRFYVPNDAEVGEYAGKVVISSKESS